MSQPPASGGSQQDPVARVQGSAFFRAWAITVLRYRWLLLAATLGLTFYMGHRAQRDLRADTSDEHFLQADDVTTRVLHEVRAQFGEDALYQVLVAGDVFSLDYLERLRGLHDDLAAIDLELQEPTPPLLEDAAAAAGIQGFGDDEGWGDEGGGSVIDEVTSLINVRRTHGEDGAIRVEGLLERWPSAPELPAIRSEVLADRTLVGQVVDGNGTHSVLVVRTQKLEEEDQAAVFEVLREVASEHDAEGFRVMVAGAPAVSATLRELMLSDTEFTMILSSVVMLLISFLFFRHPLGVLGPPLVVWQAEIWTLGGMAITDTPLTIVTTILPAFIGCVGLGDTVHVQSVYRSARADGMANEEAIVYSLATTGMPVFLTTLTTAVGLFSFRLASLSAIQEMGTFGAIGVIGALVNSIIFLPIMLTFNKKSLLGLKRGTHGSSRVDRILIWFDGLSAPGKQGGHRRRNRVLVCSALAAALGLAGLLTLRLHHDGLDWFPPDNPTRVAIDALEASVGGTANMAILLDAKSGESLRSRETLLALQRFEDHVLAYDDGNGKGDAVRNATSLLDPVRESWRAVHGNDRTYYTVPDSERGVQDMLLLFENAGPDQLTRLVTLDMKRSLMTVRVKWRDALAYLPLVDHMEQGMADILAGTMDAQPTGSVFVATSIVNQLLTDLLRSFGTAVLVITVLMVFLLRDPKVGLLAMLPNLLPIMLVMGYMGFDGIPLDTSTLMLGSVAIGIVVDDTIHFLHQFKVHHDEHGQVDAAVRHTFMHTGRAMFMTSLILVCGLGTILAAELLSSQLFGLLVGMTVVAAILLDFTFLPALLRLVYRDRPGAGMAQSQGIGYGEAEADGTPS